MPNEKLAKKIKALFDKANSEVVGEAEREAFLSKANELMMKHAIRESELHGLDPDDFIREEIVIGPRGGRSQRLITLLGAIARPHGCMWAYQNTHNYGTEKDFKRIKVAIIWGRKSTVEGVLAMYQRLSVDCISQAMSILAVPWNEDIIYDDTISQAANTRRVRDGFIEGYTEAIHSRLTKLNDIHNEESNGSLLPVLQSDFEQAQRMAGLLGKGSGYRSQYAGYSAGSKAGDKANIANRSMPEGRKALT